MCYKINENGSVWWDLQESNLIFLIFSQTYAPAIPRSLFKIYPLKIILPRCKSYPDTSTVTESPWSTRILFFLSFPAATQVTVCPFSNKTRNMALGSKSETFPLNSKIFSSFANLFLLHSFFNRSTMTY